MFWQESQGKNSYSFLIAKPMKLQMILVVLSASSGKRRSGPGRLVLLPIFGKGSEKVVIALAAFVLFQQPLP
jgi:hypothetical protein